MKVQVSAWNDGIRFEEKIKFLFNFCDFDKIGTEQPNENVNEYEADDEENEEEETIKPTDPSAVDMDAIENELNGLDGDGEIDKNEATVQIGPSKLHQRLVRWLIFLLTFMSI